MKFMASLYELFYNFITTRACNGGRVRFLEGALLLKIEVFALYHISTFHNETISSFHVLDSSC